MTYRILPQHLHSTADVVRNYLANELGLGQIREETPADANDEYRPTFVAASRDFHIYCIDVSENIDNNTRWDYVRDCEHEGRPVKFFVALPSTGYNAFAAELKKAQSYGVGVLDVSTQSGSCILISSATSLSLCGLRKFDKDRLPRKCREALAGAVSTFKNGDPSKGCGDIYDEIESLTRKIAFQAYKKGLWTKTIRKPQELLDGKTGWATVIDHLQNDVDKSATSPYSVLTIDLLARTRAVTGHRNQSAHKPNSIRKLKQRDSELRTRMETAVDLWCDLANATKSLRV